MTTTEPVIGKPFTHKSRYGSDVTIIPTYVYKSAKPRPNGACYPGNEGWYVEFRYPETSEHYREYIPK